MHTSMSQGEQGGNREIVSSRLRAEHGAQYEAPSHGPEVLT